MKKPMQAPPADLGGSFSSWEVIGTGKYNNDKELFSTADVTVYWCTTDPDGMGVDSWYFDGLFNGLRLVAMPFEDHYQVGSGKTGYTYQGKDVMYDDLSIHYNVGIDSSYDATLGRFYLGMLYYVDDPDVVENVIGFGLETVQLDGDFKDYRTSLSAVGLMKDDFTKLKLNVGFVDAKDVKVKVYPGSYEMDMFGDPGEELQDVIDAQIADKTIEPVTEAGDMLIDLKDTGDYTIVMTYLGEDDEPDFNVDTYSYDSDWSDYGVADFTDDYFASYFDEFPILTVHDVKVQKHNKKDAYRLINPFTTDDTFTKAYSRLKPVDEETVSFFVINAERPDKVYIEINPSDITNDDGVRMVFGSAAHYNIINNIPDENITNRGYWGKIEYEGDDATVTFPERTLMMKPINSFGPMFAGYNGSFKTVIHKKQSGVGQIAVDTTDAPVEYYNLQGVRVDNPSNGLYIRRQGSNAEKVFVK